MKEVPMASRENRGLFRGTLTSLGIVPRKERNLILLCREQTGGTHDRIALIRSSPE